jgi:hypothetical protein
VTDLPDYARDTLEAEAEFARLEELQMQEDWGCREMEAREYGEMCRLVRAGIIMDPDAYEEDEEPISDDDECSVEDPEESDADCQSSLENPDGSWRSVLEAIPRTSTW